MARRRRSRRWFRRLGALIGMAAGVAVYRRQALSSYETQHPELFE